MDPEDELRENGYQLQNYLFDCGSNLSTPHGVYHIKWMKASVKWIEERIDTYADTPALERFILPGSEVNCFNGSCT